MKRVAAPERTRERLRALMDGRLGTAPDRSNLVLLAAQLILEEALEAEVRDEVGRERYERAAVIACRFGLSRSRRSMTPALPPRRSSEPREKRRANSGSDYRLCKRYWAPWLRPASWTE